MSMKNPLDMNNNKPINEINMTPLVDVMLVLLIVFMITMPAVSHSVKVQLPIESSTPEEIMPKAITLTVFEDGQLLLNESPVSAQGLVLELTEMALQQPQPEIRILADAETSYADLSKVMAIVNQAGLQRLGFVSQPSSGL